MSHHSTLTPDRLVRDRLALLRTDHRLRRDRHTNGFTDRRVDPSVEHGPHDAVLIWTCVGSALTGTLVRAKAGFLVDFSSCIIKEKVVGDVSAERFVLGIEQIDTEFIRTEEKIVGLPPHICKE
jgi:hypothetical protein